MQWEADREKRLHRAPFAWKPIMINGFWYWLEKPPYYRVYKFRRDHNEWQWWYQRVDDAHIGCYGR